MLGFLSHERNSLSNGSPATEPTSLRSTPTDGMETVLLESVTPLSRPAPRSPLPAPGPRSARPSPGSARQSSARRINWTHSHRQIKLQFTKSQFDRRGSKIPIGASLAAVTCTRRFVAITKHRYTENRRTQSRSLHRSKSTNKSVKSVSHIFVGKD